MPLCKSFKAVALHSEKFPIAWNVDEYFLATESGEKLNDLVAWAYPLGVQGSIISSLSEDSVAAKSKLLKTWTTSTYQNNCC